MKFAVIVFPGSNCDVDMYHAAADGIQCSVEYVPHTAADLAAYDGILLPGGFSYGDYLRCGAIARFSPVMEAVKREAEAGKLVLGVCNGFQILLEAGLLPGAVYRNESLKFHCGPVTLRVERSDTAFTNAYAEGQLLNIPIAHGEGNYYCDDATLAELRRNRQIVFTYENNPNGSLEDIAGIINAEGNVLGMMPHPERAVEELLGSDDGLGMFQSMLKAWRDANYAAV